MKQTIEIEVPDGKEAVWKDGKVVFEDITYNPREQQEAEQPQKLNLCEILKNCPKGTKLYSTVHGEVTFFGIDNKSSNYQIIVRHIDGMKGNYASSGKLINSFEGECILLPSKTQRDWSKFTAPWYKKERFDPKTLKPFDKIIFKGHGMWFCGLFSHIHNSYACVGETYHKCVIPYNDDTKHLVGTTEEAPDFYRYWED